MYPLPARHNHHQSYGGGLGSSIVTVVLDIAVDHLIQGTKCRNVGVGVLVNYHDLNKTFLLLCRYNDHQPINYF